MKLIWHIFKKDLRQDKWALLVWALLFPVHIALGHALLTVDTADLDWIDQLRIGNILLTGLEFTIGYLLALRWVQADDVAGTRMFWVTRPISGGRLFAAKLTGALLVFGLLPVLLWLPWWLSCGLNFHAIGWMAVELLGWQLAVISVALLVGSLTDDFGRAIMWSLILVVALFALAFFGPLLFDSRDGLNRERPDMMLWVSRLFVVSLLLIGGFLAAAAAQFIGRNALRTIVRVGLLGLMAAGIMRWWPVDFSAGFNSLGWPAVGAMTLTGDTIQLSPTKAKISGYSHVERNAAGFAEKVHGMNVWIRVDGLPDDLGLNGNYRSQALLWDEAPAIRNRERGRVEVSTIESFFRKSLSLPAVARDPETIRWGQARLKELNAKRATKGLSPLEDYWDQPLDETRYLRTYFRITETELQRLKTHAPDYVAQFDAVIVRPEIWQELPLEPGQRGRGPARTLRIVSVDDYVVKVVDTTPAYLRVGLFQTRAGRPFDALRTRLWNVGRATGDIRLANRRSLVPNAVSVGGVAFVWSEVHVSPAQWIRNDRYVPKDPDWQKNTRLVVTVDRGLGHFERTIRGEDLAVQFPPDPSAAAVAPDGPATGGN